MLLRGVKYSLGSAKTGRLQRPKAGSRLRHRFQPSEGTLHRASSWRAQLRGSDFKPLPGATSLANLLLAAERDFLDTGLTRVPSPGGVPESGWWQIVRRIAYQRPFLWRDHREAHSGYLEQGIRRPLAPDRRRQINASRAKDRRHLALWQKGWVLAPTISVGQTTRRCRTLFGTTMFSVTLTRRPLPLK